MCAYVWIWFFNGHSLILQTDLPPCDKKHTHMHKNTHTHTLKVNWKWDWQLLCFHNTHIFHKLPQPQSDNTVMAFFMMVLLWQHTSNVQHERSRMASEARKVQLQVPLTHLDSASCLCQFHSCMYKLERSKVTHWSRNKKKHRKNATSQEKLKTKRVSMINSLFSKPCLAQLGVVMDTEPNIYYCNAKCTWLLSFGKSLSHREIE